MNKAEYRALFNEWKDYIKINYFIKKLHLHQPTVSHFLNGYDHCMSIEALEKLRLSIVDKFDNFA